MTAKFSAPPPISDRHAPEAGRHLRLGLIRQSVTSARSVQPLGRTDAGRRERLSARRARHEIHEDHYAARRGLSLSVHGAVVRRATAKLTETIIPERCMNRSPA